MVFVDPSLEGYAALVAGARPGVEVVPMVKGIDPVRLISATLLHHDDIRVVHVVTHGEPGRVLFPNGETRYCPSRFGET